MKKIIRALFTSSSTRLLIATVAALDEAISQIQN